MTNGIRTDLASTARAALRRLPDDQRAAICREFMGGPLVELERVGKTTATELDLDWKGCHVRLLFSYGTLVAARVWGKGETRAAWSSAAAYSNTSKKQVWQWRARNRLDRADVTDLSERDLIEWVKGWGSL